MKIKKIMLLKGNSTADQLEPEKGNTDVIVELDNGKKYIASFFTYNNIERMKQEHRRTGEYLSGEYFWVPNMVIVDYCIRERVLSIVQYFIDEGDFKSVFRLISPQT